MKPYYQDNACTIYFGDCVTVLREMEDNSVHCCVTSPPFWGLRDYGCDGQIGLEKTPEEYVAKLVAVFREVNRVLRDDGTLWLNLGDSYAGGGRGGNPQESAFRKQATNAGSLISPSEIPNGLKAKDLVGIPWRVAFALQADGWYLRSDCIWHKPNPMPESVTDRPTKAHEYIFLLSKNERYFYDAEAIKEVGVDPERERLDRIGGANGHEVRHSKGGMIGASSTRNKRTVWTVATSPYPEAHFATYPPDLIKPCILAGTSARGCCPKCGEMWQREVYRVPAVSKACPKTADAHIARGGVGEPVGTVGKSGSGRIEGYTETLGWFPLCRCNNDDDDYEVAPIPCTVLDPFGGSGTTGQVALELGRKAILIELNPKYVQLAQRRTNVTPGLTLA